MKKTYTWNVPVKMTIDFNEMYHNAACGYGSNEPDTFWGAIREELVSQGNFVYYNTTKEILKQVGDDFRNYLIEHNLFLDGVLDEE